MEERCEVDTSFISCTRTIRPVFPIHSINGLLSTRECDAWIRYGEEKGFERAFHTQTSEVAHRDNGRLSIHSPEIAAAIFSRVRPFVPTEMNGRWVAMVVLTSELAYPHVLGSLHWSCLMRSCSVDQGCLKALPERLSSQFPSYHMSHSHLRPLSAKRSQGGSWMQRECAPLPVRRWAAFRKACGRKRRGREWSHQPVDRADLLKRTGAGEISRQS